MIGGHGIWLKSGFWPLSKNICTEACVIIIIEVRETDAECAELSGKCQG